MEASGRLHAYGMIRKRRKSEAMQISALVASTAPHVTGNIFPMSYIYCAKTGMRIHPVNDYTVLSPSLNWMLY